LSEFENDEGEYMELLTSIIDLESVRVRDTSFSPENNALQIEALAHAAIALGGLVNVPVVQQSSIEEYDLISGHLEYYAYCKACEIDPRFPDRMTVFISNKKNQAAMQQQLEVLRSIEESRSNVSPSTAVDLPRDALAIRNLESSFRQERESFVALITQMKERVLGEIESKLPQPVPPLNLFNNLLNAEAAYNVQRCLKEILGDKKTGKVITSLQAMCRGEGHHCFQSFAEVLDALKESRKNQAVRLISSKKMLLIIDFFQLENATDHNRKTEIKSSEYRLKVGEEATAVAQVQADLCTAIVVKFPKNISPLEAFNRVTEPEIAAYVQRKLEFLGIGKSQKIVQRLQSVSQNKNHQPLKSFSDVLKQLEIKQGGRSSRLISEDKMIAVLDRWN
jgi:hypothetical protein